MNEGVTMVNGLLQLRIDDTLRKEASDNYSQLVPDGWDPDARRVP